MQDVLPPTIGNFNLEPGHRMPKPVSCHPLLSACFGRDSIPHQASAGNPAGELPASAPPLGLARDSTAPVPTSVAAPLHQRSTRAVAIAEAKRDLTGVVIWPKDLKKSALAEAVQKARDNNHQYGKHFHDSVVAIGEDLRRGTIHSFDQLWVTVRNARCAAPDIQRYSVATRARFASAAVPGNPLMTELNQPYRTHFMNRRGREGGLDSAVQGAARCSGWVPVQASQRCNALPRPPSRRGRTRKTAGLRCAPCA